MGRVESVVAREVTRMQGEYEAKEALLRSKLDQYYPSVLKLIFSIIENY